MEKHTNLILTGWGHAEYVTAAAVALKALKGDADVMGVSRRRLPELMEEIAERKKGDRWSVRSYSFRNGSKGRNDSAYNRNR